MDTIVVVGASLAGLRAAEALRAEGFAGELTMLGADVRRPYDRPPLSKELLAGRSHPAQVALRGSEAIDARWRLGEAATGLDLSARVVRTASGEDLPFDGLVIATGSEPRRLPALDPVRPGICELRTVDDALALRARLRPGRRLVVVGAGFIGVEVASTARELGVDVTMVSLLEPLAVAGAPAAARVTELLEAGGVDLAIGRTVTRVEGEEAPTVMLDDGTSIAADLVVSAVGVVPATDWLQGSGVTLADGVLCDERLAVVGATGVVAAGDVARWPNRRCGGPPMRVEHWTNAAEQGRAAGRTLLLGDDAPAHAALPLFWSHHFGTRMQCVGLPGLAERFELSDGDVESGSYALAGYAGDRAVAGLAYDRPRALVALRARLADPLVIP